MTRRRSPRLAVSFSLTALLLSILSPASALSASKLKVVTATTDMAALAEEVGGDRIDVESIARGYQDPHFVEAKPSFLLKLRKADLLIVVGLQLEIGWLPPLIAQSGNSRIQVGAPGYLDASQFAEILEIPTGIVTRAMGDVHPLGNPHYWLDPENGRRIAQGIQTKLAEMRPNDAGYFAQNFQSFSQRLTTAEFLLENGYNLDAMYLAGYTVECTLKALILRKSAAPRSGSARPWRWCRPYRRKSRSVGQDPGRGHPPR